MFYFDTEMTQIFNVNIGHNFKLKTLLSVSDAAQTSDIGIVLEHGRVRTKQLMS